MLQSRSIEDQRQSGAQAFGVLVIAALGFVLLTTLSSSQTASHHIAADDTFVIDVNHADTSTLCLLPGVGVRIAERIKAYRVRNRFESVHDLERVSGLGSKTVAKLAPYAVVGD